MSVDPTPTPTPAPTPTPPPDPETVQNARLDDLDAREKALADRETALESRDPVPGPDPTPTPKPPNPFPDPIPGPPTPDPVPPTTETVNAVLPRAHTDSEGKAVVTFAYVAEIHTAPDGSKVAAVVDLGPPVMVPAAELGK